MFDEGCIRDVETIVSAHEAEDALTTVDSPVFGILCARGNYVPVMTMKLVYYTSVPRITELSRALARDGFHLHCLMFYCLSVEQISSVFAQLPTAAPLLYQLVIRGSPALTTIPRTLFLQLPQLCDLDFVGCRNLVRLPTTIRCLCNVERLALGFTGVEYHLTGRKNLSPSDRVRCLFEAMADDVRTASYTILLARWDRDTVWFRIPKDVVLMVCLLLWHSAGEPIWADCRRRRERIDPSRAKIRKRRIIN